MSQEIDYDNVSFVISSTYREQAMMGLLEQPKTPSEIAEQDIGTTDEISHASRALDNLRERGLVELLVSEERKKGRINGLTEEGKQIAQAVKERN